MFHNVIIAPLTGRNLIMHLINQFEEVLHAQLLPCVTLSSKTASITTGTLL